MILAVFIFNTSSIVMLGKVCLGIFNSNLNQLSRYKFIMKRDWDPVGPY